MFKAFRPSSSTTTPEAPALLTCKSQRKVILHLSINERWLMIHYAN